MEWVKIESRSGEDHAEYRMRGAGYGRSATVIVSEYDYSIGVARDTTKCVSECSPEYCHGTKDGDRDRAMQWCEWWLGFRDAPPSECDEEVKP
jgi:hypothetical protein